MTSNNPDDGVRTCVPGGWGTGLRWIDVYLPLPDITSRVMIVDAFDGGPLTNLRTWQKHCKPFEARGTSDRGETTYAALCPELNAPQVILQANDCRVTRAIVIAK